MYKFNIILVIFYFKMKIINFHVFIDRKKKEKIWRKKRCA